jgi:flagellar basal body P-ring formation protein FlgA
MRIPFSWKLSAYSSWMMVMPFGMAATVHAATPAASEARVVQIAREHLLEHARSAGWAGATVEVVPSPREPLRDCARPIEVESIDTRHLTRMRFAAVCNGEPAWRAEVIVRGSITAEVVVAAADMKASRPIAAEQLEVARRDVSNAPDALSDPALAVGKSSRRALSEGQIVRGRWLSEPMLVKRGAAVSIIARHTGVEVHVAGEALAAGRRGEIIDVRNRANGNVIRARVTGVGEVEPAQVAMPSTSQ